MFIRTRKVGENAEESLTNGCPDATVGETSEILSSVPPYEKLTSVPISINYSAVQKERQLTSISALEQQNEDAKDKFEDELQKLNSIEPIMAELNTLKADILESKTVEQQTLEQSQFTVEERVNEQLRKQQAQIDQLTKQNNQLMTRLDELLSREQVRDNILTVHDEALSNYSNVINELQQKLAALQQEVVEKDELTIRLETLEHDVKQIWSSTQNQFVSMQQEVNNNISNIMGILGILEQKSKSCELQLDQIKMYK